MKLQRSEAEIMAKAPVEVTMGAEKVSIPVQPMLKAAAWRARLIGTMQDVMMRISGVGAKDEMDAAVSSMSAALLQFPEKIAMLVFEWNETPEEKRNEIMSVATDEQFAHAFSKIMSLAYPFFTQLAMVTQVLAEHNQSQA